MTTNPLKTGPWNLTDLRDVKPNGKKVFSTFSCGGGSTMGYKLAGYDVIGCLEIDPKIIAIYKQNFNPKYAFNMKIQDFKLKQTFPDELYDLDILDGSPPCSSFSMMGDREKQWGKEKKFKEGQAKQVLDDLFFHFIDLADKLQPKIIVAENVKGLIQGNARGYVKQIFKRYREIGYNTQLFLLNSAYMGVPQIRQRVFFVSQRIGCKKLNLKFSENVIGCEKAFINLPIDKSKNLTEVQYGYWIKAKSGSSLGKTTWFTHYKISPEYPCVTLNSKRDSKYHYKYPRLLNLSELTRIQTFPDDYKNKSAFVLGMSVPPFMMQRIADQIYRQWLCKE